MKNPTLSTSRTLLIAFLIFAGIFVMLEYAQISLVFANIVHNMSWYTGKDESLRKYNESVFLAGSQDFTGAKSILSPLLNEKNLRNPSDVFELYGDLVYETAGSTGDILTFYRRALTYGENLRIEQKITLIENPEKSPQETQSGSTDSGTINKQDTETASEFSSGAASREMKKQELEQLQKNRKGAINFSAPMPGDIQREVQGIFTVLGGGEERRDW